VDLEETFLYLKYLKKKHSKKCPTKKFLSGKEEIIIRVLWEL